MNWTSLVWGALDLAVLRNSLSACGIWPKWALKTCKPQTLQWINSASRKVQLDWWFMVHDTINHIFSVCVYHYWKLLVFVQSSQSPWLELSYILLVMTRYYSNQCQYPDPRWKLLWLAVAVILISPASLPGPWTSSSDLVIRQIQVMVRQSELMELHWLRGDEWFKKDDENIFKSFGQRFYLAFWLGFEGWLREESVFYYDK